MKEKKHTLTSSLERINILAQRMEQNEGSIPPIELDLFLQELRNLYGIALELALPAATPTTKVETEPDPIVAAPAIPEEAEVPVPTEVPESRKENAKSVATEITSVVAAEAIAETVLATETPEEPPFAPADAEESLSEYVTTNDMEKFEGSQNDELFFGNEETTAPQQEHTPTQTATPFGNTPQEIAALDFEPEPTPEPEPIPEPEPEPEPEPAQAPTTAPVQMPEPEPTVQPEPEPTVQSAPKPAANTAQTNGHSSLLSYLKHASIENAPQNTAPRTIGESLHPYSYNVEDQLTNRVNSQKVEDLRTIININDKFSFINELFHNNMKGYNDFILHLNSLQQREEALKYVETISQINHWDENSLAVKTFFSLFDRKF